MKRLWFHRPRTRGARPSQGLRPRVEWLEDRLTPSTLAADFQQTAVATGLVDPTGMTMTPDGRIFVTQQGGEVRVIDSSGNLLPTPFVSLTVDSSGERGLLGITVDPSFETDHYVYVYYTATTPEAHNRVSRFTANGNVAVPGSEVDLFDLDPLSDATNHNAGDLHFGADGKLYITSGNNGYDPNSQTLRNTLGKILRINPDGSIPTDNPFYNQTTGNNRAIWALGLRNPFRFAVQPGTGTIFINDVGSGPPATAYEEIDLGVAGANYGWPNSEGFRKPTDPPTTIGTYEDPLYAYDHSDGSEAITGGAFYDPTTDQFPSSYVGDYFYEDLSGYIRVFNPSTGTVTPFATGLSNPVDLLVSNDGSLYYLQRGSSDDNGALYRVTFGFTGWTPLAGAARAMTTATDANGFQTVFAIGEDNALYVNQQESANGWTGWMSLGGGCAGQLATARNSAGYLDVFVIGQDGQVWYRSETSAGTFANWSGLGGDARALAAGNNADGTEEVFVINPGDNGLYTRYQTSVGGAWANWLGLGGGCASQVAVARNSSGFLDAFVIGQDSQVWYRSETGRGTFAGWSGLGGDARSLAAGNNANGTEQVFWVSAADNTLDTRYQTSVGGAWASAESLGGGCAGPLAVAVNTSGLLDAFVIGQDDEVWYQTQTAPGTFAGWAGLGGDGSALAAATNGNGSEPVFVLGADTSVWMRLG